MVQDWEVSFRKTIKVMSTICKMVKIEKIIIEDMTQGLSAAYIHIGVPRVSQYRAAAMTSAIQPQSVPLCRNPTTARKPPWNFPSIHHAMDFTLNAASKLFSDKEILQVFSSGLVTFLKRLLRHELCDMTSTNK